jgi:hypothetical protein
MQERAQILAQPAAEQRGPNRPINVARLQTNPMFRSSCSPSCNVWITSDDCSCQERTLDLHQIACP